MTRTALYRHYDDEGRLLYVGVSDCLSERDKHHATTAHWHDQVKRTETEWHSSRDEALTHERRAIVSESPHYNVQFAKAKTPVGAVLAAIGTRDEIASECGVDPIAVYRWGQNGSIPSRHFAGVLRVAKRNKAAVTAEYLSDLHDQSPSSVSTTTDSLPSKKVGGAAANVQGDAV